MPIVQKKAKRKQKNDAKKYMGICTQHYEHAKNNNNVSVDHPRRIGPPPPISYYVLSFLFRLLFSFTPTGGTMCVKSYTEKHETESGARRAKDTTLAWSLFLARPLFLAL